MYHDVNNIAINKNCSKTAHCALRKACFAATASICIQDWPLVSAWSIHGLVYVNCSSLIWLGVVNSSELVRQLRLKRGFCVAYHRGRSLDRSCSSCTLLIWYCLSGPWLLPFSVCRWLPSLWTLSSVCNAWASEHHLYLHRWCSQVDALQPAPAEYCKDQGSVVYIQWTPPSATSVTHPSGCRPSHAGFRCPQPWHGRWTLMCQWGRTSQRK